MSLALQAKVSVRSNIEPLRLRISMLMRAFLSPKNHISSHELRKLRIECVRRLFKPLAMANPYATETFNVMGSMIEGSSFSGLFTRVEIGHIRIGSDGKGRIKSRGSGSSLSQRV
jgi:hypothetical protein